MKIYFIIYFCLLCLIGCTDKYSGSRALMLQDTTNVKEPEDIGHEAMQTSEFIRSDRDTADWIPFDSLKVKNLNTDQVSQLYGKPVSVETDTLPWEDDGDYCMGHDYYEIYNQLRDKKLTNQSFNRPYIIIKTFTWAADSTARAVESTGRFDDSARYLRLFCEERGNGVYKPFWGYQCTLYMLMLE